MSSANLVRDTPGRLLVAWAVLFVSVVVLAWRIHLHPADYEWTEYPTGLGDRACYDRLGANDFFEPNLKFTGQEAGLYRRLHRPTHRNDERMVKLAQDASGRFFVYQDSKGGYYLKAGDDQYVEFGARLFYPPFLPDAAARDATPAAGR